MPSVEPIVCFRIVDDDESIEKFTPETLYNLFTREDIKALCKKIYAHEKSLFSSGIVILTSIGVIILTLIGVFLKYLKDNNFDEKYGLLGVGFLLWLLTLTSIKSIFLIKGYFKVGIEQVLTELNHEKLHKMGLHATYTCVVLCFYNHAALQEVEEASFSAWPLTFLPLFPDSLAYLTYEDLVSREEINAISNRLNGIYRPFQVILVEIGLVIPLTLILFLRIHKGNHNFWVDVACPVIYFTLYVIIVKRWLKRKEDTLQKILNEENENRIKPKGLNLEFEGGESFLFFQIVLKRPTPPRHYSLSMEETQDELPELNETEAPQHLA